MQEFSVAFISGATAGIGKATSVKFARNGYNVIITGRRKDRLHELASLIRSETAADVLPLCFDVRDPEEVKGVVSGLDDKWRSVSVLVNNAGLAAGLSTIDEGVQDDWEVMIDTNIKGLLYLSRQIIPIMKEHGSGHIINIGSIAGKEVYPKGNVYCATKHAVDALTKAMRIDLLPYWIRVTGVHPGAVDTEFSLVRYKGDASRAAEVYKGFEPLHAEDVAEVIWFAASRPPHVTVNDIVIMPTAQANTSNILKKQI
jgi:3-hydroxy acid dehydrogenase / malonic semialdehyde reductase